MKMMKNTNSQKGFTLIETSIVILLLSLLLVPLFNFMAQQQREKTQIEEETINERVLAGLAIYLKNNGRYPCPADPTLTFGDADFAREDCDLFPAPADTVMSGDLPTYTLGLPFRLMMNKSGWKYTYNVIRRETEAANYTGSGSGVITIQDRGGIDINDQASFVIVNHGKDGKGAYNINGDQSIPCGTAPKDSENCDGDVTFADMMSSPMPNTNNANHYDDLLFYDLAREESTFWMVRKNDNGGMDITNRNTGNIGINTQGDTLDEKLEVRDGNIKIGNGDLKVDKKVQANEFYYQ